uniref:Ligand-dependent nuclear receptor-interacting factor 1 n=1 Tax=Leptobrachium leishanense TaxID=445787 RepID=A0A8C5M9U2_9ANUR
MSNFQHLVLNSAKATASNQCLTGCTYRIVQTEEISGRNVLKLVPVVQSADTFIPIVQPNVIPNGSPVNVLPAGIPLLSHVQNTPLSSPVKIPVVQQQTGFGNYIFTTTPGNLRLSPESSFVDHKSPPQNTAVVLDKSYLNLAPGAQLVNPTFLMVKAKSPSISLKPANMLPSGHHLQIPAHAEVKSVPASLLPMVIQQKILATTSCNEATKNPSVIYVSPVNTVKTLVTNRLSQAYPKPVASAISSVVPSSVGQSPKAPMKWIVQENKESAACLVPVKSSNDTASKILKMLSGNPSEQSNIVNVLPATSNVVHIKDNALVMYNNKIYLLAKRGSEVLNSMSSSAVSPEKPLEVAKDVPNKVVEVVLSKNKVANPSGATQLSPRADTAVLQCMKPLGAPKLPSEPELHVKRESSVFRIEDAFVPQMSAVISNQWNQECRVDPQRLGSSATANSTARSSPEPAVNTQSGELTSTTSGRSIPSAVTDQSLRLRFGLFKKEKVILKRFPLLCQGNPPKAVSKISAAASHGRSVTKNTTTMSGKPGDAAQSYCIKRKVSQSIPQENPKRFAVDSSAFMEDSDAGNGYLESLEDTDSPPLSPSAAYPADIPETSTSTPENHQVLPVPNYSRLCASPVDLDDTVRDEKIWRLKELLREREAALEAIRQKLSS